VNKSKFIIGLVASLLLVLTYPLGLFLSMPMSEVGLVLQHQLSWSLFTLLLIPIGFGLMSSVLSTEVFSKIDSVMKFLYCASFLLGTIGIFKVVLADANGIPNPDRISQKTYNNINFQKKALLIDQCIRSGDKCSKLIIELNEDLEKCVKNDDKNLITGSIYSEMTKSNVTNKLSDTSKYKKKLIYECSIIKLLNDTETNELPSNIMKYIAIILNFILIFYFWVFTFMSVIYYSYGKDKIGKSSVHVLLGSFVILLTWFPLRMYSLWHDWYYTLYQLEFYFPFWILFGFSVVLLVLYSIWIVMVNLNVSFILAVPSISALVTVISGIYVSIDPNRLQPIFNFYRAQDWDTLMILFPGIFIFMSIYTRALMYQDDVIE
tara:strand:- start:10 stop:1140 length:1131 start_codon:yes stop_codon:yes gene_type:complete